MQILSKPVSGQSAGETPPAGLAPGAMTVRTSDASSVAASKTGLAAAKEAAHQGVLLAPRRQKVDGFRECFCDSRRFPPQRLPPCECGAECKCEAGKYLPPWSQRGKNCMCRKVQGAVYNKEVYLALNSRGGALWERLEQQTAQDTRNNAGVDKMQKS
ncbi:unnamed protein product [Effrenium voratum]|nr:unnamed protein product [Effrenium voratum]